VLALLQDDFWPGASGNFPDASAGRIVQDTGMTTADLTSITNAYNANMEALKNYTLAQGKFSWQMLWTGGDPNGKGSTGPQPIVTQAHCAQDLRSLCNATSPAQVRTMMYALGCNDPANLTQFDQDLANFLLTRGPYGYLGHGWKGCSRTYEYPDALNADYGEPLGLCSETASGSGVFVREWSKATVQMDCTTWTPTITMK
jgi:hypothetical protein